jgi:hypothetical protein
MSTQPTPHDQPQDRRDGYPRHNYYGDLTNDTDEPGDEPETDRVQGSPTRDLKLEWMATELLKHGATYLDPVVLTEDPEESDLAVHDDSTDAELSDPEFYVREAPSQQATAYGLYQRRVNPDCGHLVSGGIIQDRPLEDFMHIVDSWLDELTRRGHITASQRDDLHDHAKQQKRGGETHDTEIIRNLITELR